MARCLRFNDTRLRDRDPNPTVEWYRLRYHATENRMHQEVRHDLNPGGPKPELNGKILLKALKMRLEKEKKALPRFLPGKPKLVFLFFDA